MIDSVGRLHIIDRLKNITKLSQGEYVALEKVENAYSPCSLIAQYVLLVFLFDHDLIILFFRLYVHGDSLRDHLVGIVVPDAAFFAPLASRVLGRTISATDASAIEAAIKDESVVAAVLKEMNKTAKSAKLNGCVLLPRSQSTRSHILTSFCLDHRFETVKKISMTTELFSVENDLLTPTSKLKRNVAAKYFRTEIDRLYAESEREVKKVMAGL